MRSTQTNIERPRHGDPVKLSWAQAVTDNVSQEARGLGQSVGATHANAEQANDLNDLLLRVENTLDAPFDQAGVFEANNVSIASEQAFPAIGFSQFNQMNMRLPEQFDGVKLGITRTEIAPNGGIGNAMVNGPTYVQVEFQDVQSLQYPYVIPVPGQPGYVRAAPYGNARLLWHSDIDPASFTGDCNSALQNGYVNLGDSCWYQFFKLEGDLSVCGSAEAFICNECGVQLGT